ncbi:MAG: V-type ATP synthase subunit E family protein, partial [Candidatus Bathyarchaeia archaeon]
MGLDVQRITNQILQNARENAESILIKAHKSSEMMIEKQKELARQNSLEKVSSILKKAEGEAEVIRKTIIADAKKRASWMVLFEKERLVTSVLEEVMNRLKVFSQSENYLPFLQKLIVDTGIVLSGEKLEILLREQDETLPLELDMLTKKIVEKTGKETELTASTEKIKSLG